MESPGEASPLVVIAVPARAKRKSPLSLPQETENSKGQTNNSRSQLPFISWFETSFSRLWQNYGAVKALGTIAGRGVVPGAGTVGQGQCPQRLPRDVSRQVVRPLDAVGLAGDSGNGQFKPAVVQMAADNRIDG